MQGRDERHKPAPPMPVLKVTGLTQHDAGRTTLAAVDLTLAQGEVHGLAGDRGATAALVRILAGLDRFEAGLIEVDGRGLDPADPADARRAGLWTVLEGVGIADASTVREAVAVDEEPRRLVEEGRRQRDVDVFLRGLGLGHLDPGCAVGLLSPGDQTLVQVARAACGRARVLVLDHPETGLAEHEVELLHDVLGRLVARGVALLFVTPRPHDIYELCDALTLLVSTGEDGAGALELGRLTARRAETVTSWPVPALLRSGSA